MYISIAAYREERYWDIDWYFPAFTRYTATATHSRGRFPAYARFWRLATMAAIARSVDDQFQHDNDWDIYFANGYHASFSLDDGSDTIDARRLEIAELSARPSNIAFP